MGLTKQYLRYNPVAQFGVIGSPRCCITYLSMRNSKSRYVATASVENIIVWDVRTGEKVVVLQGDQYEVSCTVPSPDKEHLAVGYSDGSIKVFNLITGEMDITFSGHRSAVSCLTYSNDGMLLASGSHDTDVVIWDLVNESGLYRLKGHKGIVTQCYFVKQRNMLITSSKDTFIKWWDLDTQHCFKTMVGHRAEVWAFLMSNEENRLITGSADSELRIWDVKFVGTKSGSDPPLPKTSKSNEKIDEDAVEDGDEEGVVEDRQVICSKMGSVLRKGRDRVVSLKMTSDGRHIACHGKDRTIELYRLCSENEIEAKLKKRQKRQRKAKKKLEESGKEVTADEGGIERTVDDELIYLGSITCAHKPCSLDVTTTTPSGDCNIVALLQNNQIQTLNGTTSMAKPEFTALKRLSMVGHRTECKSCCFTSDGFALLSTAAETAKLWNRSSQQCIRTLKISRPKCCVCVPGDRQVILGSQDGKLEIHDIASGIQLDSIEAHRGSVASLAVFPDRTGVASGGADKIVKFWEFDLVTDANYSSSVQRLALQHTRSLELDEEILAIDFTSNRRLIAIALLDCSVKVFYLDTLKFFLSLYGHSLPAGCISIATDCSLIVTGSADRNVKIWGLDFGDCHRSLFAHDDDVTSVKFVPDTHLFFSCGKDGVIKQWDADKFILIQVLKGHVGPVWAMSLSNDGDYVATTGRDKSLRTWQRTQEVVLPEEEREREREEEDDKFLAKSKETVVPGEAETNEVGMASKTTIESVKATERIMEAIELQREEEEKEKEFKASLKPSERQVAVYVSQHPILKAYGNISASQWVLQVLRKVKSSELEEALLVLPFSYIPDLFVLLIQFIKKGRDIELVCRCVFFLIRIHHGRITSNQMLVNVIEELQANTKQKVNQLKDTIGFNRAALGHLRRQIEQNNDVKFFSDATKQVKEKKKKRKRLQSQRAIMTV